MNSFMTTLSSTSIHTPMYACVYFQLLQASKQQTKKKLRIPPQNMTKEDQ